MLQQCSRMLCQLKRAEKKNGVFFCEETDDITICLDLSKGCQINPKGWLIKPFGTLWKVHLVKYGYHIIPSLGFPQITKRSPWDPSFEFDQNHQKWLGITTRCPFPQKTSAETRGENHSKIITLKL